MNYYPNNNFYQGYSYNNPYQPQQTQIQQPQPAMLQGKLVDSIDVVKVNEVPFGGFGIFPKADLSEIYIKSWNSNGTTQINTYKPIPNEESKETQVKNELLEKINSLNEKLDAFMGTASTTTKIQEKDVKVNAY